jgi:cyclic beta-1,2-glucan synthetase
MHRRANLVDILTRLDGALATVYQELIAKAVDGRELPAAAAWLIDNYVFLRSQAREVREGLPPRFYRKLPATGGVPDIYPLACQVAEQAGTDFSAARLKQVLQADPRIAELTLAELWALGPMLKLVLLEQIGREAAAGNLDSAHAESVMRRAITALRAFEASPWRDLVEAVSAVEQILREDPTGVYPRMNFRTRDACRHAIESVARRSRLKIAERQAAALAVKLARDGNRPVAYFLIGRGLRELRQRASYRKGLRERMMQAVLRRPSILYLGGIAALTSVALWAAAARPWWYLALLVVPASQAAVILVNRLVNLFIPPRTLPRMDFSEGIPDDCRTFVVVPTLLLSLDEVENLLERLEIHYLANRDPNVFFALLTDYPDSASPQGDTALLNAAAEGIRALNCRYANGHEPFFLFHRPLEWNQSEGVWMGRERKRGKLNDFNALLAGRHDAFALQIGDLSVLPTIRYVITLDSDTQLPLDTARELIATMAHPLNYPVIDPATNTVREGYAILQPRVSISMESAWRSRIARIYSGQTGFDPYTTAVSDVYQDLFAQANFTGKGIYDVRAFLRTAGERFPDNTLLSHDLIEGEHARVGLVTDLEVIDDYPSSYESYSKRKHRWMRGDWQIAAWLFGRARNPLGTLSRWKILDNLRRGLLEITLLALLLAGHSAGIVIALLLLPAYTDLLFALLRLPPPRFWAIYFREATFQFARGHLDALLTLAFLPHQAILMADAIARTLVRRHITHRRLLEWQTMAQSEALAGRAFNLVSRYLFLCPLLAIPIALLSNAPIALVELWVAAPLLAAWLDGRPAAITRRRGRPSDPDFLRGVALRTWRYFTDFATPESHWLAPDNVQQDPQSVAHRASPTNLGLQLAAHLAAHDLGYVTHQELAMHLQQVMEAMDRMTRDRGHFYNWYDTRTLQPLPPLYISTVDSGNLAAALVAVKQGCLGMEDRPLVERATLAALRDHCLALRQSLPPHAHTAAVMNLLASLLKQCESDPTDLFYWEAVLRDIRATIARLRQPLDRLCPASEEACYWFEALASRVDIVLNDLYALAPWLASPCEAELRICSRSLPDLMAQLCRVPCLGELPVHHRAVAAAARRLLDEAPYLPEVTRGVLRRLLDELPGAEANAARLLQDFRAQAATANAWVGEMDFAFLFDRRRKLLHIGYDAGADAVDPAYYDLLASEARCAAFIAIAKGEIPREAWFRLGRRLTSYCGERTLVSWSGTMFEYLMPALFMKTYDGTLLGSSLPAAVRVQQLYARERNVPWGISEAACSQRDHELHYQYRAFGIAALAADSKLAEGLVVAPYATLLAAMFDRASAVENLRRMAAAGWLTRHGFYESIDYDDQGGQPPELVRAHMAHHQGMGLVALANTLAGGPMCQRFHADPMVLATEHLLQERVPALIDVTPVLPADRTPRPKSLPVSTALPSRASAAP